MLRRTACLLALALVAGCTTSAPASGPGAATAATSVGDWTPLFDGATLAGWTAVGGGAAPSGWRVEDGAIHFAPGTGGGGDLVAPGTWGDFELSLDWKVGPCGNSGVFYRSASAPGRPLYETAPEYQVLDDTCHPDGRFPSHRAGSIYDLYAAASGVARAAGTWNEARIVARGGHIEHWLNGTKVAEADQGTPGWAARLAASKFRDASAFPGFGTFASGVIGVQDHGDPVWYRSVRIRSL